MFFFYQILISILLIFSPIIIVYRIFKKKEDIKRFKEKFSLPTKSRIKGNLIWFHGASVGEIMSIIPIIKNYEKNKSIHQILITSSTLSSSKILKKYNLKKTVHQFYPIDHFFFTKKFLNFWKPKIAIFIESEIWPCMFDNLNSSKIPLVLLNGRITKKTFDRWNIMNKFTQSIFKKITIAYPQNNETKYFLKKLKLNKIKKIGNLKFIEDHEKKLNYFKPHLKNELKYKKVWVASSTHNNEEIFCAQAHLELKNYYKNLITIIIPRHVHRVKEIVSDIENLNLRYQLHSSNLKSLKNVDIYIVDTFGETKKFHKIGSSVFLGGSIVNRGGQNPLEAARFGARILHGPNIGNFKDIYKLLKLNNASKRINSPKQLASSIIFKKNKTIGTTIKNIGEKILKKTIKELDYLIKNELKKT